MAKTNDEKKTNEKKTVEKKTNEKRRIYPYLIDSARMIGYYELLMDEGFKLKIFDEKKDKEIFDYFLPLIRKYMFWTFELKDKKNFTSVPDDCKAVICDEHDCNVFEKGDTFVVCFKTGICFVVTKDIKTLSNLVKYRDIIKMKEINMREDISYVEKKDLPLTYAYILELYKFFFMKKTTIEIKNPAKFDKVRNRYVDFTHSVYNMVPTDKDKTYEKWQEELELDKLQLVLDQEFDLIYKNNKLNDNQTINKICIALCIVVIIITTIILGSEIYKL